MWRNLKFLHIYGILLHFTLLCCKIGCFLQFTLFCRKIGLLRFTRYCVEKILAKNSARGEKWQISGMSSSSSGSLGRFECSVYTFVGCKFHQVMDKFFCQSWLKLASIKRLAWTGNLAVLLILVIKGTSVHAWLGWALCRGGGGQLRAAKSCPAARRRLLLHVHRLPPIHLPITAQILAIHFLGGCPAIKVSGWTVGIG